MAQKPSFTGSQYKEYLGEFKDEFNNVLAGLQESDFPKRILEKDFTLWSSSPDEIVNRLGWLHLPDANSEEAQSIKQFYSNISGQDFTSVLLLGMGGSSLAPEMFAKVFPGLNDLEIRVLDSTDPDYIKAVRAGIDLKKTLVIVSSKSGSTVEKGEKGEKREKLFIIF